MKVAVIGDCNSIFVKQYIEGVLVGEHETVLIVENPLTKEYQEYYKSHNIILEPLWGKFNRFVSKIPYLRAVLGGKLWVKAMVKKYGHFDAVHVHGVCRSREVIGKAMRPYTKNLIVSVWGDELLRRTKKQLSSLEKLYDMSDHITLVSDKMIAAFEAFYGKKYSAKISKNPFALGILDLIDDISSNFSREEICKSFGLKCSDKINVFVGHNGRDAQRHFEITEQINKLPKDVKDKIYLVYTMTYGVVDEQYVSGLRRKAAETGCDYVFIQGYMSEDKVAHLRLICDVLLHAQLTDAGSASVSECVYTGAIVVNGDWLPYYRPERFVGFHEMNELPVIVEDIINNYSAYKLKYKPNKGVRMGKSTVEKSLEWKKVLNS